jgi:CelD/BcsL family acetyltransferase involved in cellulose biosynthesis
MSAAVEIVSTPAEFEALEAAWWELWRRIPSTTPFQSPAWLIPWWRHFHPGALVTVAVWKDRRLIGLAPFYLEHGPLGRRLLPIGISVSDYHDVLVDPEHEGEAGGALIAALEHESSWDSLEFEELASDAAAFRLPAPRHAAEMIVPQSACPTLAIAGGTLGPLLPQTKRRHLNLARNRAARRGTICIDRVAGCEVMEGFNHLVRLHELRWNSRGEGGVLEDERVRAFHRDVLPRLDAASLLRFYTLSIGGTVVAAHYGSHHGARAAAYLTGFDPAYAYESPSVILLAHAIKQAAAEGATEFHFLRGREPYKYEWGAVDRWNRRRSFRRIAAERSVA